MPTEEEKENPTTLPGLRPPWNTENFFKNERTRAWGLPATGVPRLNPPADELMVIPSKFRRKIVREVEKMRIFE